LKNKKTNLLRNKNLKSYEEISESIQVARSFYSIFNFAINNEDDVG